MASGLLNIDESYRIELVRKAIHLCSLSIPIIYSFTTRQTALYLLLPVAAFFIIVDISRYYFRPIRDLFLSIVGKILRKHENDAHNKHLNGASYVLISATICIIAFPKFIAITSFSILIICDLTAALVGKRFGKHPFFSKSLEGSLAFFVSGAIVILFTPKAMDLPGEFIIGIVAVLVGTIVEALPVKIDDNLSIPLSVGVTMWILYWYALPAVNLSLY